MAEQSKYADTDKDTLVAAVKDRRAAGRKIPVDLRASEEKLAAALDADDMENGDFDPDAKELTRKDVATGAAREIPADYEGTYAYLRDGEHAGKVFGLKVKHDLEVRAHRTHHAKAADGTFWDGTAKEFREQFDKL